MSKYILEDELCFTVANDQAVFLLEKLARVSMIRSQNRVFILRKTRAKVDFDFYFASSSLDMKIRYKIRLNDTRLQGFWSRKRFIGDRQYERHSSIAEGDDLVNTLRATGPVIAALHKNTTEFFYSDERDTILFALQSCWAFDPAQPTTGALFTHLEIESDRTLDVRNFYTACSIVPRLAPFLQQLPLVWNNKLSIAMRYLQHPFFLHFEDETVMHSTLLTLHNIIASVKYQQQVLMISSVDMVQK